jgi:hypothetical protein
MGDITVAYTRASIDLVKHLSSRHDWRFPGHDRANWIVGGRPQINLLRTVRLEGNMMLTYQHTRLMNRFVLD